MYQSSIDMFYADCSSELANNMLTISPTPSRGPSTLAYQIQLIPLLSKILLPSLPAQPTLSS